MLANILIFLFTVNGYKSFAYKKEGENKKQPNNIFLYPKSKFPGMYGGVLYCYDSSQAL